MKSSSKLQKFLGVQNILLSLAIYFTQNIYVIKQYQLFKLSILIIYRNYHYYKKGKPYYLLELCNIFTFINWIYLYYDLYSNNTYYTTLFYYTIFPFNTIVLPLSTIITKDTLTIRNIIANTRHTIHLENGLIYLLFQYHNLTHSNIIHMQNSDKPEYSYINIILSVLLYFTWLAFYNRIMINNILSNKPDKTNMVYKYANNNIHIYNLLHSIGNITSIILSYWVFYNYELQLGIFIFAYIMMSYHTAISYKC